MEIIIIEQVANNLGTDYVKVALHQNSEYRLSVFVMSNDKNAMEEAEKRQNALWAQGSPATVDDWIMAGNAGYGDYYRNVLLAIAESKRSGGSLDMINAAGLNAISLDTEKHQEFDEWRALVGLEAAQISTIDDKRDLLMLIQTWCLSGLVISQAR